MFSLCLTCLSLQVRIHMREHYSNIVKIIFVIQCYSFIFIWYFTVKVKREFDFHKIILLNFMKSFLYLQVLQFNAWFTIYPVFKLVAFPPTFQINYFNGDKSWPSLNVLTTLAPVYFSSYIFWILQDSEPQRIVRAEHK